MSKSETQLTLYEELSEILLQLQFSHAYADNSEPYLTNQRKLARTQILALFSSHIEALGLACGKCRVRMEDKLNNGSQELRGELYEN